MLTVNALLRAILSDASWEVTWTQQYAEPGYTAGKRGVLFADWNNERRLGTDEERAAGEYWPTVNAFRSRVETILARAGFECEWSDEWSTCECGKAVRTAPDGWDWTPSYTIVDGGVACRECWADCLSVGDRLRPCVDSGVSMFAARRNSLPSRTNGRTSPC